MGIVTIFGGSHVTEKDPDYEIARELGRRLAEAGYTICNGGQGGVMEASARGAKEAGASRSSGGWPPGHLAPRGWRGASRSSGGWPPGHLAPRGWGDGKTIGITAEELGGNVNRWISEHVVVPKWRDRLFKLIELGDAYVIFDGATGTLVELFVVWEMLNKKLISKPFIIFGRPMEILVRQIQKMPQVSTPAHLSFVSSPDEALKLLKEKISC